MSPQLPKSPNRLIRKPETARAVAGCERTTSLLAAASNEQSVVIGPAQSSVHPEASAAPRIFALVIAVDIYKCPELPNLTGCKNDGKRFIRFLTGTLGVPSSQIVFLADKEATEAEILKQFDQFFIKNNDIQRDDAIIFYFAGHGCQVDAPPGWATDNNKIEILCPHDMETIDGDGKELWGISDRAIDALLRHLAFEKGDNIIVVFDCCHSGGLARCNEQPKEKAMRVRSIPPPPRPPPADLNQKIWSFVPEHCARAATVVAQAGFQYRAMESHVLLAACRPDEAALEASKDTPGGLFTTALLNCLRACSLHDTTYAMLFETLDLRQWQHPQCEGVNRDRLLFSVNTLNSGQTTFKVSKKSGRLYVSAGSIHGVTEGTGFAIGTSAEPLVLKAIKVGAFESVLEGKNHGITDTTAKVSYWHHPTLRVHSSFQHSSTWVTVIPADERADVSLRQDGSGRWELERCDPLIPVYSNRFIRLDTDAGRLDVVLDAVANFNSYLYRSGGAAAGFAGKVKMRMQRLGTVRGEINPVSGDLLDVVPSSHLGIEVKEAIITDFDSRYCFTLENTSEVDLFPYFFYFDPSDYSVQPWYKPPSPTMSAPLKRHKKDGTQSVFAFGYGGFGTNPIEMYLPPGRKTDSGFLKVFLTTAYVDMTNVAQSPIGELYSSRTQGSILEGAWSCETFVLTCRES